MKLTTPACPTCGRVTECACNLSSFGTDYSSYYESGDQIPKGADKPAAPTILDHAWRWFKTLLIVLGCLVLGRQAVISAIEQQANDGARFEQRAADEQAGQTRQEVRNR